MCIQISLKLKMMKTKLISAGKEKPALGYKIHIWNNAISYAQQGNICDGMYAWDYSTFHWSKSNMHSYNCIQCKLNFSLSLDLSRTSAMAGQAAGRQPLAHKRNLLCLHSALCWWAWGGPWLKGIPCILYQSLNDGLNRA